MSVFDQTPRRERLPDWEIRLFQWLNEIRHKDLAYGQFDCVTGLARGAVLAQTGEELGTPHLGAYASQKQAFGYMKSRGWKSLSGLMDHFLRRADPLDQHRGNIVLLESDIGPAFGVRTGVAALAFSKVGLRLFPIPSGMQEWSPI